ncbi:hypothetical protein Lal_00000726 [Lupinus albus]|nr:hypothetical protein Lal_00000726 [Lupinus albus]
MKALPPSGKSANPHFRTLTMNDLTIITTASIALPEAPFRGRHFIDGAWCDSANGETFERVSPSHGVVVSRSAKGGRDDAERAIAAARKAFDASIWSRISGKERATVLLKVADLIEANVERMAILETLESGKPISQARDARRRAEGADRRRLDHHAVELPLLDPEPKASLRACRRLHLCRQAVRNDAVDDGHAGRSSHRGRASCGVVNIVLGFGQPVGQVMAEHAHVDMVTFTGSTAVGKAIMAAASGTLKKVALELGGKNPQVIFPDADLDSAADAVTFGVYFNAGECCNSGSRIIVHEDIAEAFVARVVALSKKVAFGDPLNPDTQVGAIISSAHLEKIDDYVRAAVAAGAKVQLGGGVLPIAELPGRFYKPTVVTGVTSDMPIAREEVFGPVLSVLTFRTLEEAIDLVNDASYGLSAGVWSENVHTCLEFSRRVQVGTVWTNTWMDGFPELTFGGFKQSGQGREIGPYGLDEFLEVKTVVMRVGRTRPNWVRS